VLKQCLANVFLFQHNKCRACTLIPSLLPCLPPALPLSRPSLYACLQDCGVISSGAYQPPLGNCLQMLDLQQGGLRPLRVLPAPTPVQEDLHRHHQQAAEAWLLERIRAWARDPSAQHTRCRVTEAERRHGNCQGNTRRIYLQWRRELILVDPVHVCLNLVWRANKRDYRQGHVLAQEYHCACILSSQNSRSVQCAWEDNKQRQISHPPGETDVLSWEERTVPSLNMESFSQIKDILLLFYITLVYSHIIFMKKKKGIGNKSAKCLHVANDMFIMYVALKTNQNLPVPKLYSRWKYTADSAAAHLRLRLLQTWHV